MSKLLQKLGLKKPPVIDYWDCSKLNLVTLPKEVLRHRHTLRTLFLNTNHIRDVPKTVFLIESLEELDLSENDILFIPPGISRLCNLTSLVISKNSLASVPDAIRHCEQLLTLDLSVNPLASLCEGLVELRQLRKLILNDTQLEDLPPNIGKLSKLEILELRENLLQTLPVSMGHLTLLEKLDIGNNEFVTVPTVIGNLESLSELWLDTNTINSIPQELGNLHNLRFLEISENHIMLLPNTISGWVKLTDLYANENLLSSLPDSFGELASLTIAKLNGNRLGGLPETVYGLTSLVELDLSHNHITELPRTIGGMTSLVSFNLDENLLVSIPAEVSNCTALKSLSLRDNQLFEVPPECSSLVNLKILNLIGNRLSNLPFSLTTLKNLSAIWVSENQSRPIVELQVEKNERGEKWLTCFLFPQQGHESPYEEASSPLDAAADEDPSVRSMRKTSQVNFDPQVMDKRNKISRDPTPFPKELHNKAMQWRAARNIDVGGEDNETHPREVYSPGLDEVALRLHSHRRLVKNRYSLLKALADPLDDSLNPTHGRRLLSASGSPPLSPAVIPTTIRENPYSTSIQSGSSKSPTSPTGLAGSPSPTAHAQFKPKRSSVSPTHNPKFSPTSPTSQTRSTGSDIESPPPLPPIANVYYPNSPEGSDVHSIPSRPYLDPPAEFASNSVSNPLIPSSIEIQHSQNGSIVPQHNLRVGSSEHHISHEPNPPSPQAHNHSNTNGNNNNGGSYRSRPIRTPHSISIGRVNEMMVSDNFEHTVEPVSPLPIVLQSGYYQSQASTLSRSDVPDTRSSMESGFDADNELETWYTSPNSSPKSRRRSRENRPKLGPKVVPPSFSPPGPKHIRIPSESRDSHHSGSQLSQGESVSDDYERLVHDPHHEKARILDQRRGSLDAVVMLSAQGKASTYTYGVQPDYDQAYPVHKPSRSLDATRGHMKRNTVPSHHSQASQRSHPPHSPRSPISPTGRPPYPQRSVSAKSQRDQSHVRTYSQPEELLNRVNHSTRSPSQAHSSTHSHSQPHNSTHAQPHSQDSFRTSKSNEHSPTVLPAYNHQQRSKSNDKKQRAMVTSDESVFQSNYPGHKGVHHVESKSVKVRSPTNRQPPRSPGRYNSIHNSGFNGIHGSKPGNGRDRVGYHSELQTFSKIVENQPHERVHHHTENFHGYSNNTSDESQMSGRDTPVATPTLVTKSNWVSGHDSGFESMNRNNHTQHSSDAGILTHTGIHIEVELMKNPTLGLGITGGREGENAIKPGDTGFHVYKVVDGLPAQKCGKIAIGDKLLEVNGYDVSSMTCEDVLALLTCHDSVSLRLFREASLTLL